MRMFTSKKLNDYFSANLWQGVIMILIVSLFNLVCQDDNTHAQGNGHDTSQERTALSENRNLRNREVAQGYAAFYRVIVENNIFRPLGWKEPISAPKYVLIGTMLDSRGGIIAKALLKENASNQTYYVTTGEKVGTATVESIESRQVRLNISGEILTLKAPSIQFLNVSNVNTSSPPSRRQPTPAISVTAVQQQSRGDRINRNQTRTDLPSNVQKIVDWFRHGTQEERIKIAEEFERRQQRR